MKKNSEIISRIIESARKIALIQQKKDEFVNFPIENTEKAIKEHERKLLDYDFEINSLAAELNILKWLFEESEEE